MPTAIDLFEKARSHERLEQLKAAREHDLLPYFRLVGGRARPGRRDGGRRARHARLEQLPRADRRRARQGGRPRRARAYGTGLTGSRFMNGTTPLHLELERELADWMGTEDALVFTTGYQANVGAIGDAARARRHRRSATRGDHASIMDGVAMSRARIRPFRHNRLDKLETMLDARRPTAAACSSWWTACSRWRATSATLPRVAALAASTARG